MSGVVRIARDVFIGKRYRHFSRALRGKLKFKSSLGGGFEPQRECLKRVDPERYKGSMKIKTASVAALDRFNRASPLFTEVDRILAFARANGLKVVLMTTPWNEDQRAEVGEKALAPFTATVRAYAEEKDLEYLDFLRRPFPEESWFDGVHLNAKGAGEFTRLLAGARQW